VRQRRLELGAISALAAFGLDVLGDHRPSAAVQVGLDRTSLRFKPETAASLLVGRDAEIGDEFSLGHASPNFFTPRSRLTYRGMRR
jgi:hypothetical protein